MSERRSPQTLTDVDLDAASGANGLSLTCTPAPTIQSDELIGKRDIGTGARTVDGLSLNDPGLKWS